MDQATIDIADALIVVVGLGGVGSHCAHALLRAGVRRLRLIDFDRVSLSSLNRHAVATRRDVGTPKVAACANHFREIAPDAELDARDEMFTIDAARTLLLGPTRPTLVVDCIDDVTTKSDLLAFCVEQGLHVVCALGSGAKNDPTQLCVAKGLRDIENDPLATKLRKVFTTRDTDLSKVSFVYSSQRPQRSLLPLTEEQRQNPGEFGNVANFRLRVIPVLGTQPALAGVALATQTLLELKLLPDEFHPRPCPAPRRALVDRWVETFRKRDKIASADLDVTVSEAMFLVHEVWCERSAIDTENPVGGASGLKFAMAAWEKDKPVNIGNMILATEKEVNEHLSKGLLGHSDECRQRVSKALEVASHFADLPNLKDEEPESELMATSDDDLYPDDQTASTSSYSRGAFAGTRRERSLMSESQAKEEELSLLQEQLSRSAAFLGAGGQHALRSATVAVVGCGAVGSSAAVLLVRAGVGRIILVDPALVKRPGRHMLARGRDVGAFKADVCRDAMVDILHDAVDIEVVCEALSETNADKILRSTSGDPIQMVVDCTGGATKLDVLTAAVARKIPLVSVGNPDGLKDPTRVTVTPMQEVFASTHMAVLRQRLRDKGYSNSDFQLAEVVHSLESNQWLSVRSPRGRSATRSLAAFCLGLAAAATALCRLAGEAREEGAGPGAVGAWKRLRRALATRENLDFSTTQLPDIYGVGSIVEQVWRGRSAFSRSAGTKPSEALTGMAVIPWDRSRPLELWNLVLLTEEEAAEHARLCGETGSLPVKLLEALSDPQLVERIGSASEQRLLQQQLRTHRILQRLEAHLLAEGALQQTSTNSGNTSCRTLSAIVARRPSPRSKQLLSLFLAGGAFGVALPLCARQSGRNLNVFKLLGAAFGLSATWYCASLLAKKRRHAGGLRPAQRLRDPYKLSSHAGFAGLVGQTRLVKLGSLSEALGQTILAKAEFLNPGGCQKDRVAQAILEEAIRSGSLRPGGTIVEGTSGSTGISLSLAAASRGFKAHIVMPDDQAAEKVELLRRYGAEVELVRPASISNPEHYVNVARRRAEEMCQLHGAGAAFFADQFENLANFRAHYEGTGPELWAQSGQNIDAFVMSSGTGGTLAGVGRFLKEVQPNAKTYLADVQGSSLYNKVAWGVLYADEQAEQTAKRHRTDTIAEGIGIDRLTKNFSMALSEHNGGLAGVDGAVRVTDQEALEMAHHLLAHEGLFLGSSAAVNCAAAVKVGRLLPKGSTITTILCDGGARHLTKFWNPNEWPSFGLEPPVKREPLDLSFIH